MTYLGFEKDLNGNVKVIDVGKKAGENLTEDVTRSAAKTIITKTHDNVTVANNSANMSNGIDTSLYRTFRVVAAGSTGNVDLRVEWSPDNGTSGWYYVNEASGSQWPTFSGNVIAPYLRVVVTNQYSSNQNINAWIALQT